MYIALLILAQLVCGQAGAVPVPGRALDSETDTATATESSEPIPSDEARDSDSESDESDSASECSHDVLMVFSDPTGFLNSPEMMSGYFQQLNPTLPSDMADGLARATFGNMWQGVEMEIFPGDTKEEDETVISVPTGKNAAVELGSLTTAQPITLPCGEYTLHNGYFTDPTIAPYQEKVCGPTGNGQPGNALCPMWWMLEPSQMEAVGALLASAAELAIGDPEIDVKVAEAADMAIMSCRADYQKSFKVKAKSIKITSGPSHPKFGRAMWFPSTVANVVEEESDSSEEGSARGRKLSSGQCQ